MSERNRRVVVEFQLDVSENIRALRGHLVRSGGLPWVAPAAAGTAALVGTALYHRGWPPTPSLTVGTAILLAAGVIGVVVAPRIAVRRSPELTVPWRLEFDERGIFATTDDREERLSWDRYDRWERDEHFYFLYYAADEFTLVPRRVLSDDEEGLLDDLLEENVELGTGSSLS